jgi:hypothetical protein
MLYNPLIQFTIILDNFFTIFILNYVPIYAIKFIYRWKGSIIQEQRNNSFSFKKEMWRWEAKS